MSKISPLHIWKKSDNIDRSQTTRSNNEEATTESKFQIILHSLRIFDIDFVYLAWKGNILVDILSGAHLEETADNIPGGEWTSQVHMVYENAPATQSRFEEIKEETAKDLGLKEIRKYMIEGWPKSKDNIPNEAKSYWSIIK